MGESIWRRPMTELRSYPTELDAHVTLTDQRRIRIRAVHRREERPIRVLRVRRRSWETPCLDPLPAANGRSRRKDADGTGPNPYGRQGTRTRVARNGLT